MWDGSARQVRRVSADAKVGRALLKGGHALERDPKQVWVRELGVVREDGDVSAATRRVSSRASPSSRRLHEQRVTHEMLMILMFPGFTGGQVCGGGRGDDELLPRDHPC